MYYHSKEFKSLKKDWYKKLKDSGFKDLESENGDIQRPEIRTINWKNNDRLLEFFLSIGKYLNQEEDTLRFRDKLILILWSNGRRIKDIVAICSCSYPTVYRTIKKHTNIVLNEYFYTDIEDQ